MITKQFQRFLFVKNINNSEILDRWCSTKLLFEKTFSNIFIVNGFFDFFSLSVIFYEILY